MSFTWSLLSLWTGSHNRWFPGCTPVDSPRLRFLESLVGTERPLIPWFDLLKDVRGRYYFSAVKCTRVTDSPPSAARRWRRSPRMLVNAFILNSVKVALRRSNLDLNDHRQLSKVIPDLCRLLRARSAPLFTQTTASLVCSDHPFARWCFVRNRSRELCRNTITRLIATIFSGYFGLLEVFTLRLSVLCSFVSSLVSFRSAEVFIPLAC